MDRLEKIGTILVMTALVAVLVNSHRRNGGKLSAVRVNTPELTFHKRGPAYLLAALPIARRSDEYADPASYYTNGGAPYQPSGWQENIQ